MFGVYFNNSLNKYGVYFEEKIKITCTTSLQSLTRMRVTARHLFAKSVAVAVCVPAPALRHGWAAELRRSGHTSSISFHETSSICCGEC
jgi:hypothetical protein